MQSLKTLALGQIVTNTLNTMVDNANTFTNDVMIIVSNPGVERFRTAESTFNPNLGEALATSRAMVQNEEYKSILRFRGTIDRPQNGEPDEITINKQIGVYPGKIANLDLSIKSHYADEITQFTLTIQGGFATASQICKNFYLMELAVHNNLST